MKRITLILLMFTFPFAAFSNAPVVVSSGFTFSPSSIAITTGDSVIFQLASIHDVVEVSLATWNADGNTALPGGFSLPFGGGVLLPSQLPVGIHYFVCSPHAHLGMKGTITVSPIATTFQTLYGLNDSSSDGQAASIVATAAGGFVTAGYISNFGGGQDDVCLLKLDANGDTVWVKTYGATGVDDATQVIKTMDGGYAIVGVTYSFPGENAFIIKTDSNGNLNWAKIYGTADSSSDASVSSVVQATDGGFVVSGYISNYGAGSDDFYTLKTDAGGNISWTKTYGGSGADDAYGLAATSDGGYVTVGATMSFADTLGDVYLIKMDANGDTLWTMSYGSSLTDAMDMGNSVQQTTDNGYIITGVTMSASQGEYALLIKTDSNGVMLWSKLYGTGNSSSDVSASSVIQTTDGGYAFTGYVSNFGAGDDDYLLIKTDANGDTTFTRAFGSTGADDAYSIAQSPDGGFIMAGVTTGFYYGGGHGYFVKTDAAGHSGGCNEYNTGLTINTSITFNAEHTATQVSTGGVAGAAAFNTYDGGTVFNGCININTGVNEVSPSNVNVSVYPVPFSTDATVKVSSPEQLQNCVFVMFNAMGQQLTRMNVPGDMQFNIQGNALANGFYFYQLQSGNQVLYNGKLTIAH